MLQKKGKEKEDKEAQGHTEASAKRPPKQGHGRFRQSMRRGMRSRRLLLGLLFLALAAGGGVVALGMSRSIEVVSERAPDADKDGSGEAGKLPPTSSAMTSPFTGLPCAHPLEDENGEKHVPRPVAVMLAADEVARPLSGIAHAELVVEMPVITGSINRFMAVFACAPNDTEIGSIRSARDDFIPLAAAFDAVYAHWGGSHFALDDLRGGVIDNIDALINPFGAYFRKRGIAAPHNGFTILSRLRDAAEKLGYRETLNRDHVSYAHLADVGVPEDESSDTEAGDRQTTHIQLTIGYPGRYRVTWEYDAAAGRYLRTRGARAEIDQIDGTQVAAGTIVVARTESRQIEGQYNDVRVTGEGEATVYRNGEAVEGRWRKEGTPLGAPLRFLNADGALMRFAQGPVWIAFVEAHTLVTAE